MGLLNVLDEIDETQIEDTQEENSPVTTIPPPAIGNNELTGYKQTVNEPSTSETITTTDYSGVKSRPEWEAMTGSEPWEAYAQRLGIREPEVPVNTEDRERRLRTVGLMKDLGNGLFTLGEAIGLGQGASVRRREMQQAPELAQAEALRNEHPERYAKYQEAMQRYYKNVQDYNKAMSDRYNEYLKSAGTKTSTTTKTGGDSTTYNWENPDIAKRKFNRDAALRRISNQGAGAKETKSTGRTHPLGDGRTFTYDYSGAKDNMRTASNNARIGIGRVNLSTEALERIKSSVKGGDYSKFDSWTESDDVGFVAKTVEEFLLRNEHINSEIERSKRLGDNVIQRGTEMSLRKERQEINNALNNIYNSGFTFGD